MKIKELVCVKCGAPLQRDILPNQQIECDSCGSVFIAQPLEVATTVACQKCRTTNPVQERFCSSCGESLKIDCILCHIENIAGTVYCANCGAHLSNARTRRKQMQQDRREQRQERNRLFKEKEVRQKSAKLQQLLDDLDEPENHEFALYKINQMGADAIEPLIETLLHDDDPDARYGSARALGQICNNYDIKALIKARASKALIAALNDKETAVRYWSANALGKCKGQTAIKPLSNLLKDKHQGVREQAAHALEQIGGNKAEKILSQQEKNKGILGWMKGS